jgi:hypothetical protein
LPAGITKVKTISDEEMLNEQFCSRTKTQNTTFIMEKYWKMLWLVAYMYGEGESLLFIICVLFATVGAAAHPLYSGSASSVDCVPHLYFPQYCTSDVLGRTGSRSTTQDSMNLAQKLIPLYL